MAARGGGRGCCCGSDGAGGDPWDDEKRTRRVDAVRAADGLPAVSAHYVRRSVPALLMDWWRSRKVPVRNPQYPPRQAWEVNPTLRKQIEGHEK